MTALDDADTAERFSREPDAVLGALGINGGDREVLRLLVTRLRRLSRSTPVSIFWPGPGLPEFRSVRATCMDDGSHVFVAIIELTDVNERPPPEAYLPVLGKLTSHENNESFSVRAPTLLPTDPAVLPTHAIFEFTHHVQNVGTYDLTLEIEDLGKIVSISWPSAVTVTADT